MGGVRHEQRPKSEIRNPKEGRNPKSEASLFLYCYLPNCSRPARKLPDRGCPQPQHVRMRSSAGKDSKVVNSSLQLRLGTAALPMAFGLRISDLGPPSLYLA